MKKLQNYGKIDLLNFTADKNVKSFLEVFFLESGIVKLVETWQKVIQRNGQYIDKVFVSHRKFIFHLQLLFDQPNIILRPEFICPANTTSSMHD